MKITGVHEHAEYYPMLSEEQLEELAADIKENGQRDPITVTSDGILIDGRNRWEACKRLGIEPQIEIEDPKDVGSFVRSRNERRHQSTGSRAMSTALSLEHDGKRKNGRWARGSVVQNSELSRPWQVAMVNAGIILDEIRAEHSNLDPQLAWQVVDGTIALDDAYKQARDERDKRAAEEEKRKRDAAKDKERDKRAREFFADERNEKARAWLEERKDAFGDNMRAAFEAYKEFDDKLRKAEEARREAERRRLQEHRDSIQRTKSRLEAWLDTYTVAWDMRTNEYRDEILSALETRNRNRFLTIEKETTWPTEII